MPSQRSPALTTLGRLAHQYPPNEPALIDLQVSISAGSVLAGWCVSGNPGLCVSSLRYFQVYATNWKTL